MSIEVKYKEPARQPIQKITVKNMNCYEVCWVKKQDNGRTALVRTNPNASAVLTPQDLRTLAGELSVLAKELEQP